jgi:hypothetical protein
VGGGRGVLQSITLSGVSALSGVENVKSRQEDLLGYRLGAVSFVENANSCRQVVMRNGSHIHRRCWGGDINGMCWWWVLVGGGDVVGRRW